MNKPQCYGLRHSGKLKTVKHTSRPTRNDLLNKTKSLKDEANNGEC